MHLIERRPMPPLGHFSLIRFGKLPAQLAHHEDRLEVRAHG